MRPASMARAKLRLKGCENASKNHICPSPWPSRRIDVVTTRAHLNSRPHNRLGCTGAPIPSNPITRLQPHRGHDEEELDEDGAKRQDAAHQHCQRSGLWPTTHSMYSSTDPSGTHQQVWASTQRGPSCEHVCSLRSALVVYCARRLHRWRRRPCTMPAPVFASGSRSCGLGGPWASPWSLSQGIHSFC